MKTPLLVGIVVAIHCIAVGSIILIQGCGTMRRPVSPSPEPKMPPTEAVETTPVFRPPVRVDKLPVKKWPSETTMYIVKKGECLSSIAQRYGLSVAEIAALNGIGNADMIRSGHKLILPGKIDLDKSLVQKTVKPILTVEGEVYVVKRGDSLSVIAAGYGTTVDAIKKANMLSSDRIMIDQKLVIPRSSVEEVSVPAHPDDSSRLGTSAPDIGIPELDLETEPAIDMSAPDTPGSVESKKELKRTEQPRKPVRPVSFRIHVVQPDEDLYSVAMMWGVSVAELKELNRLTDTSLKPGDRLKIPMAE